ncbi:hypothetical protein D3C79_1095260 [compost metagenome]
MKTISSVNPNAWGSVWVPKSVPVTPSLRGSILRAVRNVSRKLFCAHYAPVGIKIESAVTSFEAM